MSEPTPTESQDHRDLAGEADRRPSAATLLYGLFAGPLGWILQFQLNYAVSASPCESRWRFGFHVAFLLAFALAGSGFLVARHSWIRTGRPDHTEGPRATGRTRFMVLGGMLVSLFFLLVISMQTIPSFFLEPCDP